MLMKCFRARDMHSSSNNESFFLTDFHHSSPHTQVTIAFKHYTPKNILNEEFNLMNRLQQNGEEKSGLSTLYYIHRL